MSKGDETRQRIVALAAAMFNQHGSFGIDETQRGWKKVECIATSRAKKSWQRRRSTMHGKLMRSPQNFATDRSRLKSKDAKGESHESNSYQH